MFEKIYFYFSPFVAAVIASWLTYFFAIRKKRHEVLLQEKFNAFKAVQVSLTSIRRYCEAGLGELSGQDFEPAIESLPKSDPKSALEHTTALQFTVDENRLFLSTKSQQALRDVIDQMRMLCNMELLISSDPSFKDSSRSGYEAGIREVDTCLNILREDLMK